MQSTLSNKEVGNIMKSLAALMELHEENPFKIKSYANAAFQLSRIPDVVMEMDRTTMEQTKGIGKSVAAKLVELRETGDIEALRKLLDMTPAGIIDMLQIKGLGAKKVRVIWKELGVEDVGELLYACYENRLAKLKGFGEKTQESVIQSIEYYQANLGKFHFATALQQAALMEADWKQSTAWSRTGALRREAIVIEQLEWLTTAGLEELPVPGGWQQSENGWVAVSPGGIPMVLHVAEAAQWATTLLVTTGNEAHVDFVLSKVEDPQQPFEDEAAIYKAAGLTFVPAFLREDLAEWEYNDQASADAIISMEDIQGVVHNHSTWSDGRNTIREMAEACMARGYTYLVMSDHSKTAVYAGGLDIQQVRLQQEEIDLLNEELAPFKIFKSIESDILNDGSLDYPDEVLASFDLVIASVHSNLRMDAAKANERLLRAIENPYTSILGHMTGRLLLSRPGYPVDHQLIIDACAANRVAIEVNANPYRLDMDYHWIPYAQEKGIWIPVNPDAHSTAGIDDIYFGVTAARKGGLRRRHVLNALPLSEFEKWLKDRKAAKGIA